MRNINALFYWWKYIFILNLILVIEKKTSREKQFINNPLNHWSIFHPHLCESRFCVITFQVATCSISINKLSYMRNSLCLFFLEIDELFFLFMINRVTSVHKRILKDRYIRKYINYDDFVNLLKKFSCHVFLKGRNNDFSKLKLRDLKSNFLQTQSI